jgi:DNA repair protein RadC
MDETLPKFYSELQIDGYIFHRLTGTYRRYYLWCACLSHSWVFITIGDEMTLTELFIENEALRHANERLRLLLADRVQEASLSSSKEVALRYMEKLSADKQENFFVVLLDNKHRAIKEVLVSRGTLNQSLVHPREVFASAIEKRAAAIIILHNHPSGDTTPSSQDIDITKRLVEVGQIVGINVLDHIIVGGNTYLSFLDEELL